MKSTKTTADKKNVKLELAKETVRSLHVKSDVRTGYFQVGGYQVGNGGVSGPQSSGQTTVLHQCK